MARAALGDRTNLMNPPRGKLGTARAAKKAELLAAKESPQQYIPTYNTSPMGVKYRHDPYASPSPQLPLTASPAPPTQVPELQPYSETYYDYPQQETIPPPPLLQPQHQTPHTPAAPTPTPAMSSAPSTPAPPGGSPTHYTPTWQMHTDVHAQSPTTPSTSYFQPQPPAEPEPPADVNGIAVVKFRFNRSEEHSVTFPVKAGEHILVGGDRGVDLGVVTSFTPTEDKAEKKAVRMATESELHTYLNELPAKEAQVVKEANEIISNSGIRMDITNAEFQFDMAKLTLYYTSPTARTDWRPVLNDLFRKFQCRIWFRKSTPEN